MTDRKSWEIKDEAILDDLVALIDLTVAEREILAALQESAREVAPALSEAFYRRLMAHPLTAEYVGDQVEARRGTLEAWFIELFQGKYGRDYVGGRLEIGRVHVAIGLPIRYPLAMMDVILEFGMQVAAQSHEPEQAANAFRKLLALDIAIFTQSYEDTQLKHLAETMGNERLARRLLTQEGLFLQL